jgi:transposase
MQLQTILNHVQKHKSFVYDDARFVQIKGKASLEVPIKARSNGRPLCSGCGKPRPGYDRLDARRFEFIPLWGIAVFFLYAMRRVDCPRCGVTVEQVPWAQGKEHLCTTYRWFLARWAKRLPWKQVAQVFGTSWDAVYGAVHMAVVWGLEHRSLDGIQAIGVDEIQWLRGQHYLTLVYELGPGVKRLLYIAKDRTQQSLRTFFHLLGKQGCAALLYICTDMWQPYLTVIEDMAGHAVHVLDRFHIMKKFNEAIDQVRREEAQRMQQQG